MTEFELLAIRRVLWPRCEADSVRFLIYASASALRIITQHQHVIGVTHRQRDCTRHVFVPPSFLFHNLVSRGGQKTHFPGPNLIPRFCARDLVRFPRMINAPVREEYASFEVFKLQVGHFGHAAASINEDGEEVQNFAQPDTHSAHARTSPRISGD